MQNLKYFILLTVNTIALNMKDGMNYFFKPILYCISELFHEIKSLLNIELFYEVKSLLNNELYESPVIGSGYKVHTLYNRVLY